MRSFNSLFSVCDCDIFVAAGTGTCLHLFRSYCSVFICLLQLDVRLSVQYMSFSAHADAKGIMQLISQSSPASVLLVHGEAAKMEFLKDKIQNEFGEFSREGIQNLLDEFPRDKTPKSLVSF